MSRTNRRDPKWTKFEQAYLSPEDHQIMVDARNGYESIWRNSIYQVQIRTKSCGMYEAAPPEGEWPDMIWLSIKRNDKRPIDHNNWRVLQRIKNEILGPEYEAVQLFPAESRLVDTSNQYHLWALASDEHRWPFGFQTRLVASAGSHGSRQRPFEKDNTPEDLADEQINEFMNELHRRNGQ